MNTEEKKRFLEELKFEPYMENWESGHYAKGYGKYGANGELVIHPNGTFNLNCYSSVYDEIVADIAKLREKGIVNG